MLVEKEIIRDGIYWYRDEQTGLPRKLTVTPELRKYWHEQGSKMLAVGLTVPVPYEHDFTAHPMTPKDKLLNNAGEVKEYRNSDNGVLSCMVDVQDPDVKRKIGRSIRWTSPWISSFTDGDGREWNNVISHLALTTRPRVIKQAPFNSIAAALSMATETKVEASSTAAATGAGGLCLSRAGLLHNELPAYPMAFSMWGGGIPLTTDASGHEHDTSGKFAGKGGGAPTSKDDYTASHHHKLVSALTKHDIGESKKKYYNRYALGHYMRAAQNVHNDIHKGGRSVRESIVANFTGRLMDKALKSVGHEKGTDAEHRSAGRGPMKDWDEEENKTLSISGVFLGPDFPPPKKKGDEGGNDVDDTTDVDTGDDNDLSNQLEDANGDIGMEELLCDLLQALGVPMPDESNEAEFKRHLYEAAMAKIKELTSEGMGKGKEKNPMTDQNNPDKSHTSQPNPLVQQEQQPMYMSLEEINKLPDPMKGVALAMYAENQKLRTELDANTKVTASLRDAKLKEAGAARTTRVALLGRLSPKVKADLDAMLALPAMALSMGEGGVVIDPMATTLAVLEKGLSDLPRLLTTEQSALSVQPQPQDANMLTEERQNEIAESLARQMGCPPVPERKAG